MKVLLVEDNKADQIILQEAFQESGIKMDLNIVEDGVEAIEFLNQKGTFQDALTPDLVILDLNLPRKNGREVLTEIKNSPRLEHMLVLILSNSSSPADVCECYRLKANIYMKKPSGYKGFIDFASMLKSWKDIVQYCYHEN